MRRGLFVLLAMLGAVLGGACVQATTGRTDRRPIDEDPPGPPTIRDSGSPRPRDTGPGMPPPPTDSGPGMPPPAMVDFGHLRAFCDKAHSCRNVYPDEMVAPFVMFFGNTAAECAAQVVPGGAELAAIQAGIAAGRIGYDPNAVSVCAGVFTAATCMTFWTTDLTADGRCAIFGGTVATGQPCSHPLECMSGDCMMTCR